MAQVSHAGSDDHTIPYAKDGLSSKAQKESFQGTCHPLNYR